MGRLINKDAWWAVLLTIISLPRFVTCSVEDGTINPLNKIVSGIYSEQLPLPILYHTYIPVILEYNIPQFSRDQFILHSDSDLDCPTNIGNGTNQKDTNNPCRWTHYQDQTLQFLHEMDFTKILPDNENSEEGFLEEFPGQLGYRLRFCNRIESHFSTQYISPERLEQYYRHLKECSTASQVGLHFEEILLKNISSFDYNIKVAYTQIKNSFRDTFQKLLDDQKYVVEINELATGCIGAFNAATQATMLTHFYAERNRWNDAFHSCQSRTLPSSLVSDYDILDILKTIQNLPKFKQFGYKLSIPSEFISKYFTLPITDCTETNSTFVVRLLIPLIRRQRQKSMSFHSFHKLPFIYRAPSDSSDNDGPSSSETEIENKTEVEDLICTLKNFDADLNFDDISKNNNNFLYDNKTKTAYPTLCRSNQLCFIPGEQLAKPKPNLCASMIFDKNLNHIYQECELSCEHFSSPPYTPLVAHMISISTVVFSGHGKIQIVCEHGSMGHKNFYISLSEIRMGSLELRFNCDCKIYSVNEQTKNSELLLKILNLGQCKQNELEDFYFEKSHIVPIQFVNSSKISRMEALILSRINQENGSSIISGTEDKNLYLLMDLTAIHESNFSDSEMELFNSAITGGDGDNNYDGSQMFFDFHGATTKKQREGQGLGPCHQNLTANDPGFNWPLSTCFVLILISFAMHLYVFLWTKNRPLACNASPLVSPSPSEANYPRNRKPAPRTQENPFL